MWVLIKPQSKEKGIKTTWVQSYTSNKAIRSKGKSSVPKLLVGFCLLTAPSPSMLLDPSSWHRSRNEQCIDLFLWFLLSEQNKYTRKDALLHPHTCISFLHHPSKQAIVKHMLIFNNNNNNNNIAFFPKQVGGRLIFNVNKAKWNSRQTMESLHPWRRRKQQWKTQENLKNLSWPNLWRYQTKELQLSVQSGQRLLVLHPLKIMSNTDWVITC